MHRCQIRERHVRGKLFSSFQPFFGILPPFPVLSANISSQREQTGAIETASAQITSTVTRRRVSEAPARDIPQAADQIHQLVRAIIVYVKDKN